MKEVNTVELSARQKDYCLVNTVILGMTEGDWCQQDDGIITQWTGAARHYQGLSNWQWRRITGLNGHMGHQFKERKKTWCVKCQMRHLTESYWHCKITKQRCERD